jgi:cell division protein ZapA (FtsZ GTPase activity inhibitor)
MPADDHPLTALERRFEMEDLPTSPVTNIVLDIASRMQLPWPVDKVIGKLKENHAADSLERIGLMLTCCVAEILKHDEEIKQLRSENTSEDPKNREEVFRALLLDAARKAESTRATDRVKRIGLILANAVVESTPTDADEVEEMMRVSMELGDRDIEFLRELIRIEGAALQTTDHISRYDAYLKWEQGFWGTRISPEIDSVFSKLESYGLVVRIPPPNNLNITADYQNRYVLLKKGVRFAALIRESLAKP